jgi:DNA-binding Lrp family transcriptional regulator
LLSGTFESFPLAEVLGLIERAAASGVLMVRAREVDGSLWFVDGALCAGEIGDLSGPVEGRHALEVRLLEVAVPLLRARAAEFEFREDITPPWPAPLALTVETIFEPARRIAREWAAIMTTIESFESVLERTGEITTESITLSHLGFRVLEQVDGRTSIRELARRAGVSIVAVAPEVRALVVAGAVRVIVDAERALATARASAERDRPPLEAALDVTELAQLVRAGEPVRDEHPLAPPEVVPMPVVAPVAPAEVVPVPVAAPVVPVAAVAVAPAATDADDALARERADLAARAGLTSAGPVPETATPEPETAAPERAQIVVDRSELLRMFSGLKDE